MTWTAHLWKTVLLVTAALGVLSVSQLDGFGFVVPYIAGAITFPIFLGTWIWDLWKTGAHPRHWKASPVLLTVLMAFLGGVFVGRGVNRYRIAKAKAFAGVAVPVIESYRKTHSTLPTFLHEIPGMPPLPSLLSPEFGMQEGSIRLNILNPNDYSDNWAYLSERHEWVGWSL